MRTVAAIDTSQHLLWLGSRSFGVVALILVAVAVGLGLALSTRISGRPGASSRIKTLHEAVSLVSLLAIIGHGMLLLGDSYLRPSWIQIAVPFLLPNHTLWTGIGVIAGWLALLFTASFYLRRRIGVALWRKLHRFTPLVFALGLAHTMGSGTDSGSVWLILMLALAAAPVALVGGLRVIRLADPPTGAVASGPDSGPRATA